jgi:hypothetical protein
MKTYRKLLLSAVFGVAALSASSASAINLLTNGSFESPNIGTGAYTYPGLPYGNIAPIGATQGGWTFNGSALVNGSGGNAWYSGAAPAGMDGVQFASLQGTSTLSQTFTANSDTLHLGWTDAGRSIGGMGDQTYQVLLGSDVFGTFNTASSDGAFGFNTLDLSGLSSGTEYTLTFKGLAVTDQSAFLDNVRLSDQALALPPIVTLSSFGDPDMLPLGQQLIANFNTPAIPDQTLLPGFDLVLHGSTVGWNEGGPGYSGTLPNDPTNYLTIPGGQTAELFADNLMSDFSLFMGSPDTYNWIRFLGPDYDYLVAGGALTGGNTNQSWDWGMRANFDFGGARVNHIILGSNNNSFESDNWATRLTAVPEPATWAMMIMGFGAIGALIRRRRALPTLA